MSRELQFAESITALLIGASHSVEVMLSLDEGWNFPIPMEDITAIADQRLELRLLLRYWRADEASVRRFMTSHNCAGWSIRCLRYEGTANCVIVDRECVFVAPFGRDADDDAIEDIYCIDEPIRVTQISGHFERLWIQTEDSPQVVFDDFVLSSVGSIENSIVAISAEHWNRAIEALATNPRLLYSLPPRKFEELIAELLSTQGFQVKLTPPSDDGGFDILAYDKTTLGNHLFLVECKRYAPNRPVGVEFVRSLFGVVEERKATGGMLVTSSRFTAGAIQKTNELRYRMALKDYHVVMEWLAKFLRNE